MNNKNDRVFGYIFANIYPLYIKTNAKIVEEEVDQVICWLTGSDMWKDYASLMNVKRQLLFS